MGIYHAVCLLWIFVHLVQAQVHPTVVGVPPLQWIRLNPTGTNAAPALAYSAAGFDSINNQLVLFGGETSGGLIDSNTHLLNLGNLSWTSPNPTININIKPPGRSRALFGHDLIASYRNGLLVYGGRGQEGALSDIWEYNFSGQFWFQVTGITGDIPTARYSATGGGDPPSASNSDTNLLTTFWLTGGVESPTGSTSPHLASYEDIYRLQMSGTIAGNFQNPKAMWTKVTTSSASSTGNGGGAQPRSGQAGLVLRTLEGEAKLGVYGGCVGTADATVSCAQQDAHVVGPVSGTSSGGQWNDITACPSARIGAVFVPNLNNLFNDMVFLLFGLSPNTNATDVYELGSRGEIDVLSVSQGTWSRVLPSCDPSSTPPCPVPREGAAVVSSANAMAGGNGSSAASAASDIIIFGGKDKDGNVLNDAWILRATTAQITQTNQTNWSPLYGNGVLGSGIQTNGQGVTVEFLTQCAQAATSGSGPSGQPPNGNGGGNGNGNNGANVQWDSSPYIAGTSHKVLAASSVIVVLASIILSRGAPSASQAVGLDTSHQVTRSLVVLVACTAWALGIAGFVTSLTSTQPNPELSAKAGNLTRRDSAGSIGFVNTGHAIVGVILFALVYLITPALILGQRRMKKRAHATPLEGLGSQAASDTDDKAKITRRSLSPTPPSEHPQRPANPRSSMSHRTAASISTGAGPVTPGEEDPDAPTTREVEEAEDEPIGAGKKVRLSSHRRLSAPSAFFKEQLWPAKSSGNGSGNGSQPNKRERLPSHPSSPPSLGHSKAASIASTAALEPPASSGTGGGGFVVLNRGKHALDRSAPLLTAHDLQYQRRAPTTLGEVSWLERRRNVHMINDLDYAMSQQATHTSHRHSSPLVTPTTQYSKPLLSPPSEGDAETAHHMTGSAHRTAESLIAWTTTLRCAFHLLLLALCIFTAASIFRRDNGSLSTPLGVVFVLLVSIFYISIVALAVRGKPDGSVATIIISRLRTNGRSTGHEGDGEKNGMELHSTAAEMGHVSRGGSPVMDNMTLQSSRASKAFIQQSRYSVEINDSRGQDVRIEAEDEDEAEDIEREMGRRDVSIVTVPKRRLFIANSDMP